MRYLSIIIILISILFHSCTTEKRLFEVSTWWYGHWQSQENPSYYFSSGHKKVGSNEIVTSQFFISTLDSILDKYHLIELIEFDHKDRYKLMKTSDDNFIKIKELDETHLEIYGPAQSKEELESIITEYIRLPETAEKPKADSLLYDEG